MIPTFTVITPSYKTPPAFLAKCIDSVLLQKSKSYRTVHVIIFNGEKPLPDISYDLNNHDAYYELIILDCSYVKGVSKARNIGLSYVDSTYYAFLDADDFWPPLHLEKLHSFYTRYDVDAISTPSRLVYGSCCQSNKTSTPFLCNKQLIFEELVFNCIGSPSGFSFKSKIKSFPFFYENLDFYEDYLFYLDLFFSGWSKIYRVNNSFFYYRVYDGQATNKDNLSRQKFYYLTAQLSQSLLNMGSKYHLNCYRSFMLRFFVKSRHHLTFNHLSLYSLLTLIYPPYLFSNLAKVFRNYFF